MSNGTPANIPFAQTTRGVILIILLNVLLSGLIAYGVSEIRFAQLSENEKHNLAYLYIMDLNYVNETNKMILDGYNNPTNPDFHRPTHIINQIYPDWGMFYSTKQDLSKFNPDLAQKIHNYYMVLLEAEQARVYINNYDMNHPIDQSNPIVVQNANEIKLKMFNSIIDRIELCNNETPSLIQDLEKVTNS